MRDRLIELLGIIIQSGMKLLRKIADYLLANGVIEPPCKVGDTVYTTLHGKIFCYTVLGYGIRDKRAFVYAENDRDILDFPFTELGKTVFLTREEAEQALKAGDLT